MVVVCVQRHSDSQFSRAIEEAIKSICYQKQCPNEERILRFVLREFDWKPAEVSRQLRLAVEDGLLKGVTAVSHKGSTKGNEQMSYRSILNPTVDSNANIETKSVQTHDWYCFDCQESGEVVLCDHCPKVFHRKCAKVHYISQEENWKCPSCKAAEENNSTSGMSKQHINNLLKFTIQRMKEKFQNLTEPIPSKDSPGYRLYIFRPVALNCIETDITKLKFTSPGHFLEEIKWLLHNAIVYFGDDDELTILAEELVEDAKQEVEELLLCPDCYFLANSKPENWFCKPCNPPHELVYAKMTGQPPWPAKVLKWNEDKTKALVRFFEALHQRAWVYFRHIAPITRKPDVKKRPRQWLDAQEELSRYQQQLRELTGDVKPKTEPKTEEEDQNLENGMDSTSSESGSDNCVISESCQTEEDPNKAVIDKLRKRIDDLEQDLNETKEKLNLQQNQANSHRQDGGNILTFDAKNKVQKFIATLSERLQKNIGRSEVPVEQMKTKNLEREHSEFECRVEEIKKKMEEEKICELEKVEATLKMKHDKEITEFCESTRVEKEDIRKKAEEEKQRELREAKATLQRNHEDELKKLSEVTRLEREKLVAEFQREKELVLRETVRETKRKQWCCNCEQEASYPCCWNTSYCSRHCQLVHWQQHRILCSRNFSFCLRPPTRN